MIERKHGGDQVPRNWRPHAADFEVVTVMKWTLLVMAAAGASAISFQTREANAGVLVQFGSQHGIGF